MKQGEIILAQTKNLAKREDQNMVSLVQDALCDLGV